MKRWAPETLAYLKGQGFTVDPNKTLGENIVMNGGTAASGAPAGGAPATGGDWRSLLGAEPPSDDADLGSVLSDAVSGPSNAVQTAPSMPLDPLPPVDLSYAPASETPEVLGARYQNTKDTRKLSPLGQLFTLPTIGQPKPAQPQQTQPFSMGIG